MNKPTCCQVNIREVSSLTPDELQKVFDARKPIVLRGLRQVRQWPAMQKWSSREYLEQHLPYMKVCELETATSSNSSNIAFDGRFSVY